MEHQLANLRLEIESIDIELLGLLAKRFGVVKEIGLLKKDLGQNALNSKRWEEVLVKVENKCLELGLDYQSIRPIWENIHSYALALEKARIDNLKDVSK